MRSRAVLALVASLMVPAAFAYAQPTGPAAAPLQAAPAPLKVAILDTQKVLRDSEEGLRIEANLRKLFDAKQADLLTREKALTQEYDALAQEEKSKGKADAALEKKKNEFKQRYAVYQQAAMEFQRDFNKKQNDMYNPMLAKIGTVVMGMAQKEGFDVVVEKQAAVYFRKDLEITERVIAAYNAGDPAASKEPKPKAPAKAPAKSPPKK
jgi:outer membrane protein